MQITLISKMKFFHSEIHLATKPERLIWFCNSFQFFFFSQYYEKETFKKTQKTRRKKKKGRKRGHSPALSQQHSPKACCSHASALHHAEHTLKPRHFPYEATGMLLSFLYNYLAPFPHFPLLTYQTEPLKLQPSPYTLWNILSLRRKRSASTGSSFLACLS